MTTERRHEEKPWQPKMERELEFNPFVNPLDRTGELENPPPLQDWEAEAGESVESGRVPGAATGTTASTAQMGASSAEVAEPALIEPERRHALIAQAAYFLAERRGLCPGAELEDWLAAETEIDRLLASERAASPASGSR